MSAWAAGLVVWAGAAVGMAGLWAYQRIRGEADVVDLGWTVGLGVVALFLAAALDGGLPARRWLVAGMAAAWSVRLASLLVGRVRAEGEDGRYRTLRRKWSERAQRRFFVFFQVQAFTVALLSAHFALAMLHPAVSLRVWDAAGVLLWAVAVGGEAVADRQLQRFKADPRNRGRTCRRGLWRYSRHPNYFFEWLHWWAYAVVAVGAPWWPATLLAPAVMYVLMRHVTGVPPAEARALESRGEDYRRYRRATSAFFPWLPDREADAPAGGPP